MAPELNAFLTELSGRRQRLLQLVRPGDDPAELIEELTELSEQLVIAEEELRVQQEELATADARVRALVSEREELRGSATEPYVLTDRRGVVLRANPAADRLVRRPSVRTTPRPIATWFEVADRPTIRTMISQVLAGQQDRAEVSAVLRHADRSTLAVRVTMTVTPGGEHAEPELLWHLRAESTAEPAEERPATASLQLVDAAFAGSADNSAELAAQLTGLAAELAGCETEEELVSVALQRACELVPNAEHAGLLVARRHGKDPCVAPTTEPAAACLQLEIGLREGPVLTALAKQTPVLVSDIRTEPRWVRFAEAAVETGVRSVVAVEMKAEPKLLGALCVYAERPDAFDSHAVEVASLVATQLGLGLDHLRTLLNLRAGLDTRAAIGEAMGVLMERHRITSADAFRLLVAASQRNNVKLHAVALVIAETGQDPATLRVR
ncbi:MAG: GAF and ANTAR domain-containing protein [Actinobacteria bacterium]|nr:GAF and ANTAR domain-containing protein [Actinomycetota bacterium]